jgi:hypothetical protein
VDGPSFRVISLGGEVWRVYRRLFAPLILGALLVYVPMSLIDAVAEPLAETHGDAGTPQLVTAIVAALVITAVTLVGEVMYAGIVSSLVCRERGMHGHSLGRVLKALPYGRLAGADIGYSLVGALGALLLVVPGLVFMTWFALVAPAIEIEDRGLVESFRRSREVVRGHFWKVFVIVVPLTFAAELLADVVFEQIGGTFGHTFLGDWLGSILSEVLTAPFLALFLVLAFIQLRGQGDGEVASTPAD